MEGISESDTSIKSNNILRIITDITDAIFHLQKNDDFKQQVCDNRKLKLRIKKLNKRLAAIISNIMMNTTREQDNRKLFKNLSMQQLLNNYSYVVDSTDDLTEISNNSIDLYVKDILKKDEYKQEVEKAFSIKSDCVQPVYAGTSELVKRTFNYLAKPQLKFDPRMDNSYFQFVPSITSKENAISEIHPKIKQLQAEYLEYKSNHPKIIYDPNVEIPIIKYPNPYEEEINSLQVDWKNTVEEISKTIPKMPPPISETDFEFIEEGEQLLAFIDEIGEETEIAVDLEFHAYRSFQGFTCLMQLSTKNKDYIIDTISLRSDLHMLNKVFTNPKVVKIFHGSKSDILWLQKDFGIYIVNLFDTCEVARILGLKASLSKLLWHYCEIEADKQYQLADWRQRPLPQEMLNYARQDTHYLHYLYDIMRRELLKPKSANENPLKFLISAWKNSQQLCHQLYQKPLPKDSEYYFIMSRNAPLMGEGNIQVLDMLMTWRDYIARVEDESTKYVMPNDVLFDIAKSTPKDICDLKVILGRHPKQTFHEFIYKYEEDLLTRINKIIDSCTETIKSRILNTAPLMKDSSSPIQTCVRLSDTKICSKIIDEEENSKNAQNKFKISKFSQRIGLHELLGIPKNFNTYPDISEYKRRKLREPSSDQSD